MESHSVILAEDNQQYGEFEQVVGKNMNLRLILK